MTDLDSGTEHLSHVASTVLRYQVKDKLIACFRRHGAVETQRQTLIPRSDYYTGKNIYQLLDASGTLLQLPYDLTLPLARSLARQDHAAERTFTFGTVYRDASPGSAPHSNEEADFDIVSYDSRDLALKEAEVIMVMDEVLAEIPALISAQMCFHISHSDLLEAIMDFCPVAISQRAAVKKSLGKLNIQQGKVFWTWEKVRRELGAPSIGVSSISLDAMAQFDFRDTPEKCFMKLQNMFVGTAQLPKIHKIFTHISGLCEYLKCMGVRRKVYCNPLSSFNDQLYQSGVMFQCLFDNKKRAVIAAGGRYDRLIEDCRPRLAGLRPLSNIHAVGINIAWDILVRSMERYQVPGGTAFLKDEAQGQWAARRCDVLVASFDATVLCPP